MAFGIAEVYSEVEQGLLPKWCIPVAAHGLYLSRDFLSDPAVGSCKMTLLLKLKSCAFGLLAPPSPGVPCPPITIGSLGPCTPSSPRDRWGNVQVRILGKSEHASFDDVQKHFGCSPFRGFGCSHLLCFCLSPIFGPRLPGKTRRPEGAAALLALCASADLRGGQLPPRAFRGLAH